MRRPRRVLPRGARRVRRRRGVRRRAAASGSCGCRPATPRRCALWQRARRRVGALLPGGLRPARRAARPPADIVGESFYNPLLARRRRRARRARACCEERRRPGRLPARLRGPRRRAAAASSCRRPTAATATRRPTSRRCATGSGALGATRLVYVVGAPQAQHFAMVFDGRERRAGSRRRRAAEHVAFGNVLGADGKMLRTRAGGTLRARRPARRGRRARAPRSSTRRARELDRRRARDAVARAVGIGAVKYADLSSDRDQATTSSTGTACSRSTATPRRTCSTRTRASARSSGAPATTTAPAASRRRSCAPAGARPRARAPAASPPRSRETVERARAAPALQLPVRARPGVHDVLRAPARCCAATSTGDAREPPRALRRHGTTLRAGLDLLGIEAPERM